MFAHFMSDEHFGLAQQTAAHNLVARKASGVVKTLKYYSADDTDVCAAYKAHHGVVVSIWDAEMGVNLPPLPAVAAISGQNTSRSSTRKSPCARMLLYGHRH